MQATDQYLAVRNARIVLCDDTGLRAATTTMWLRGMGHDVSIFEEDVSQALTSKVNYTVANTVIDAPLVSPEGAFGRVSNGAILVDASAVKIIAAARTRSIWITRSRVTTLDCRLNDTIIVTGQEKVLILGVVSDFLELGFTNMFWFEGSPEIWSGLGLKSNKPRTVQQIRSA